MAFDSSTLLATQNADNAQITGGNVTGLTNLTATTATLTTLGVTTGNFTALGTMPAWPVSTPAAAGTVVGNATALTTGINIVTGADDTKGVALPANPTGKVCVVVNSVSNKILKVWPSSGTGIDFLAADGNLSMGNGTAAIFVGGNATWWWTIPATAS